MGEGQTSASAPSVHKSAVTDCRAAVILLTALGVQSVVVQSAHTDGDPESHHPGSLWPVCNRAGGSSRKNHLAIETMNGSWAFIIPCSTAQRMWAKDGSMGSWILLILK